MKVTSFFTDILYLICNIFFYILITVCVFTLITEIFTNNGKIGTFYSKFHSSFGYELPVDISIEPQDLMFNDILYDDYKQKIEKNDSRVFHWVIEYTDKITLEDSSRFKSIVGPYNYGLENSLELTSDIYKGEGYVRVKPKKLFDRIIIIFRSYANFILLIAIFFILKKIFRTLITSIKFSHKLFKSIQVLGILIILMVFISIISNSILGEQVNYFAIEPLNNSVKYIKVRMTPRLDFNFTLFIAGLSILVLSMLLKEGHRIQKENQLTI